MNQIQLIGRLCKDLNVQKTVNHHFVLDNLLAVRRDSNSDVTDFLPITAWDKTAILLTKYCQKGDQIGLIGQLQSRTYTNKEGIKKTSYTVWIQRVTLLQNNHNETQVVNVNVTEN